MGEKEGSLTAHVTVMRFHDHFCEVTHADGKVTAHATPSPPD
jgi:hypothetical protein